MNLEEFVKQYPTLNTYKGSAEEKLKALIGEYHHKLQSITESFELQNGSKKMPALAIFVNSANELLKHGAPIVQVGSPLAIINAIFDYAENHCGHARGSAVHALSSIINYVDVLEHELDEYYFAEGKEEEE